MPHLQGLRRRMALWTPNEGHVRPCGGLRVLVVMISYDPSGTRSQFIHEEICRCMQTFQERGTDECACTSAAIDKRTLPRLQTLRAPHLHRESDEQHNGIGGPRSLSRGRACSRERRATRQHRRSTQPAGEPDVFEKVTSKTTASAIHAIHRRVGPVEMLSYIWRVLISSLSTHPSRSRGLLNGQRACVADTTHHPSVLGRAKTASAVTVEERGCTSTCTEVRVGPGPVTAAVDQSCLHLTSPTRTCTLPSQGPNSPRTRQLVVGRVV